MNVHRSVVAAAGATLMALTLPAHADLLYSYEGSDQGWVDSFNGAVWTQALSGSFATDGNQSLRLEQQVEGFRWGKEVLLLQNGVGSAEFADITTSTKMMFDVTILPGTAGFFCTYAALNFGSNDTGFFYIASSVPPAYQVCTNPTLITAPITGTYVWDFQQSMLNFGLPNAWFGLGNYLKIHFSGNSGLNSGDPGPALATWFVDNMRTLTQRPTDPAWQLSGGGNWTDGGSWANGVPNGIGAIATLGRTIADDSVVTLNSTVTVGQLVLDGGAATLNNSNDYTISGSGVLNMQVSSGTARIAAIRQYGPQGAPPAANPSHVINVPVNVNSTTWFDTTAFTTLTVNAPVTISTGAELRKTSAGTLNLNGVVTGDTLALRGGTTNAGANVNVDNVVISGGGKGVALPNGSGVLRTRALTVDGTLDLTNNAAIIDYGSGDPSPLAMIAAKLTAAYSGGAWTGGGITSSSAAAAAGGALPTALGYGEATDLGVGTFAGQAVDATAVLIRYTIYGDANLDRTVNIGDFSQLAANFNQPSRWTRGDFNFDGTTNISDFSLLAANFNVVLTAADLARESAVPAAPPPQFANYDCGCSENVSAAVPEPGVLGLLAGFIPLAHRRRR